MKTKRAQEGYLLIDHRNSPGVRTLKCVAAGPGEILEAPTITCSHCQAIMIVNPGRTRERGYCAKCDHYICDTCALRRECIPFAKITDLTLSRAIHGLDVREPPTLLLKG